MNGDDDTDDGVRFTRRSLLAGLGTVGAASAGAGLGTTALFSDEESFTDNVFEAGALNMRVTVDNLLHSTDVVRDNTEIAPKDTADGNAVTVTVSDLKPGDWLILSWQTEIIGGPGYVQVTSVDEDYGNDEAANPESETDTAAPGDLGDALLSTIWQTWDNLGPSRQYLEGLDGTTCNNDSGLSSWEQPDLDGVTSGGAHYTTLNEAHGVYESGVAISDPGTGDPVAVGSESDDEDVVFYQLLELPPAVGNDIQGDEAAFTLRFDAEQARNNSKPFDGA